MKVKPMGMPLVMPAGWINRHQFRPTLLRFWPSR
jgi:hypothetical protein